VGGRRVTQAQQESGSWYSAEGGREKMSEERGGRQSC